MKPLLISAAIAGCVTMLAACTPRGREAAYGAPYTDITRTSTEPGTYRKASPYRIIDERQEGANLVIDANIAYAADNVDQVGKQVVEDRKGNATAVTVHVYAWDQQPPAAPWRTVKWNAGSGFSG